MSKNVTTAALDAATFAYWGQKVFPSKVTTAATVEENNKKWREILGNL